MAIAYDAHDDLRLHHSQLDHAYTFRYTEGDRRIDRGELGLGRGLRGLPTAGWR